MEFDEAYLFPFECTELKKERVLVIAPHPDDETYGCGGALCRYKELGSDIRVVVLTDGAMGDYRGRYDRDEYVRLRQEEVRCALAHLGIDEVEFRGYPDRGLPQQTDLEGHIQSLIQDYAPSLVFCTSPLDIHPDHRYAAQLVYDAVRKAPQDQSIRVAFCEVVIPFQPTDLVDITSVYPRKRAAMECFATQQEELDYVSKIVAFNHYRSFTLPSDIQYVEAFWMVSPAENGPLSFEHLRNTGYFRLDWKKEAPLVSVIVRTRNRPEWLRQALTSIQAQTYPNLEVVVVNDGGDPPGHILEPFKESLSIIPIDHEASKGRPAAANSGLAGASGKYVTFLDDDDLMYPQHVATLVHFAQQTGARVVYSDCDVVRYRWNARELAPVERKPFQRTGPVHLDTLLFENQLPNMTVLLERGLTDVVGYFDESLEIYEDWDFWIRLAAETDLHHVPQVTAEYRQLGEEGIGTGGRAYDFWGWTARVWEKHWERFTPDLLRFHQEKVLADRTRVREKEHEQEKSKLHHELFLKEQANEQLQRELDHLRGAHENLAIEHEKLIKEHNHLGQEHDRVCKEYNALGQEHEKLIKEHNHLGQEHEKLIREYNHLGQEHDRICKEYNALGQEHDRICRELNELKQERQRILGENAELRQARQALEAQINDIYASASWKMTSPYRRVGGWLKRS